MLVGVGVGAVNGVIATFFRINSLIATLAMSFVITGVASLVTNGNLIMPSPPPRPNLSPTLSTPIGDVAGVADRAPFMSLA